MDLREGSKSCSCMKSVFTTLTAMINPDRKKMAVLATCARTPQKECRFSSTSALMRPRP